MVRVVREVREVREAPLARMASWEVCVLSVRARLLARLVSRQVSAQARRSALQPGGEGQVGEHWAESLQDNHSNNLQYDILISSGQVRSGLSYLSESVATASKWSRQMLAQLRLPWQTCSLQCCDIVSIS